MSVDLDELEQVAREAPPGPWRLVTDEYRDTFIEGADGAFVADGNYSGVHVEPAAMAYLAAAHPGAVLELIAEVRRLRAGVEHINERADYCGEDLCGYWVGRATQALLDGKDPQNTP